MIEVDISGTEFSYDMKALAIVFYPEKECRVVEHPEVSTEDGYSIKWQMDGKKWEKLFPNPYTKNQIKKEVYEYLKTKSKRTSVGDSYRDPACEDSTPADDAGTRRGSDPGYFKRRIFLPG